MIRVDVELFRREFHGTRAGGMVDFPPSPVRLVGALKSGAHALTDENVASAAHRALAKLVTAPPPVIETPPAIDLLSPTTYTNRTWLPARLTGSHAGKYLDTSLLGFETRSREAKASAAIALAAHGIAYFIDAELDDDEIEALDSAAAHVGYFGRSMDAASFSVSRPEPDHLAGRSDVSFDAAEEHALRVVWRVVPGIDGETRSWQPNTLEWMDANYERVFSADPLLNRLPPLPAEGYVEMVHYDQHDTGAAPPIEVFLLDESVEHHRIPMLMAGLHERLREAPFEVDDLVVFPLTVSDHAHGDGRCVGIGVAPVSRSGGKEEKSFAVPGDRAQWKGPLEKAAREARRVNGTRRVGAPHAAHPTAWVRSARRWRSTTPARFFPDIRIAEVELRHALRDRFGVEVAWFTARPDAVERWESTWGSHGLVDGLGQWWLEFETDTEIEGPVVLGAARELGFGVFAPRHADPFARRKKGARA